MKKFLKQLYWIIPLILIIAAVIWVMTLPKVPASEIVSTTPVHWHPRLAIMIHNEPLQIPSNIGTGPAGAHSQLIHTHDTSGALHMEMGAPVYKRQTRLSEFFKAWDKPFTSTQILEYHNGPEGTVKMYVNGQPNEQYGDYEMKDGDKIEIRFD